MEIVQHPCCGTLTQTLRLENKDKQERCDMSTRSWHAVNQYWNVIHVEHSVLAQICGCICTSSSEYSYDWVHVPAARAACQDFPHSHSSVVHYINLNFSISLLCLCNPPTIFLVHPLWFLIIKNNQFVMSIFGFSRITLGVIGPTFPIIANCLLLPERLRRQSMLIPLLAALSFFLGLNAMTPSQEQCLVCRQCS